MIVMLQIWVEHSPDIFAHLEHRAIFNFAEWHQDGDDENGECQAEPCPLRFTRLDLGRILLHLGI